MPERLQRKRTKGWRKPEGAVCVTRPGPWGNPYKTAEEFEKEIRFAAIVAKHNQEGSAIYSPLSIKGQHIMRMVNRLEELRGKDLLCFCSLNKRCHADVLLEMANANT